MGDELWWCQEVFTALGGVRSTDGWMNQIRKDLADLKLQVGQVQAGTREKWKNEVKKAVKNKGKTQFQKAIDTQPSMRFLKAKHEPKLEQYMDGSKGARLLFQARTGQMECTGSRRDKVGKHSGECARTNPNAWGCQKCQYCGMEAKDDVQHLLIHCTAHEELRQEMWANADIDREVMAAKSDTEQIQDMLGISTDTKMDLRITAIFLKKVSQQRDRLNRETGEEA